MKLTAFQRKLLNQYRRCRVSPPSLGGLLFSLVPLLTLLTIVIAIVCTFGFAIADMSVCLVFAGVCTGVILLEFRLLAKFLEAWPVLAQVIDWQRVDSLLGDDAEARERVHDEET